jgi:hypothetical protein
MSSNTNIYLYKTEGEEGGLVAWEMSLAEFCKEFLVLQFDGEGILQDAIPFPTEEERNNDLRQYLSECEYCEA